MMKALLAALLLGAPAQPAPPPPPPTLIVAISVDQFSADLFAEYRRKFTKGMKRLQDGVVFPSAYQSHASTRTCPGHSTILTGIRPGHTGIISNNWMNLAANLDDKNLNCMEDETVSGSTHDKYVPVLDHLRVATLGDRMKAANPAAQVVAVSGKDRVSLLLGGRHADVQTWWSDKTGQFVLAGGRVPNSPAMAAVNAADAKRLAAAQPEMALGDCEGHAVPVQALGKTFGTGRYGRAGGDAKAFQNSPEYDAEIMNMAIAVLDERRLGHGPATDLLAIGLSSTDEIGHAFGFEGSEMCLQMRALDETVGRLLDHLDKAHVDYAVMLTADHGAHDLVERQQARGIPFERWDGRTGGKDVSAAIGPSLGLTGQFLWQTDPFGDVWIDPKLSAAQHDAVLAAAKAYLAAQPQVATVFTKAEILAAPEPSGPPDAWPMIEIVKAGFDPERSGDLFTIPKPRVTPAKTAIETHGIPYPSDRRVPLMFWRKGMAGFEQPAAVETVDIVPTLAAMIHLPLPAGAVDGRCLDLDLGAATSCP